jgi:hypothetical protein
MSIHDGPPEALVAQGVSAARPVLAPGARTR